MEVSLEVTMNHEMLIRVRDISGDELRGHTTVSALMSLIIECCEEWDVVLVDVLKEVGEVEVVDVGTHSTRLQ